MLRQNSSPETVKQLEVLLIISVPVGLQYRNTGITPTTSYGKLRTYNLVCVVF